MTEVPHPPTDWGKFARSHLTGDPERMKDCIRFLANQLPYLYRTRVAKLLYLAEIEHIRQTGNPLTGARFKSDHYGPNSPDIGAVLEIVGAEEMEVSQGTSTRGHDMTRYHAKDRNHGAPSLTATDRAVLTHVITQWGKAPHDSLVKASKATEPYASTPKGDWIDMNGFVEECRHLLAAGLDPHGLRKAMLEAASAQTFATREEFASYLDS